jgi:DTW domain-containing protein YfiP
MEARAASNSARLASLWLTGSTCHVRGETRQHQEPAARAEPGLRAPDELIARPGSALLFPGGKEPAPPPGDVRHLIVPDGTWSQARRLERRWFASAALPRVELAGHFPSAYGLRRRADPQLRSQLCTFEAIAIAIAQLADPALARTLLARFAEWARRARWLKSGGPAPDAAPEPLPLDLPEHPASRCF